MWVPFGLRAEPGKGRARGEKRAVFGGAAYDGSLVRRETPGYMIGLRTDIRAQIKRQPGSPAYEAIRERESCEKGLLFANTAVMLKGY